jgi:hypothetical protein
MRFDCEKANSQSKGPSKGGKSQIKIIQLNSHYKLQYSRQSREMIPRCQKNCTCHVSVVYLQ